MAHEPLEPQKNIPGEAQEGALVDWRSAAKRPEGPINSQWVTFGHRVTFTFVYGVEVGSIHFDRSRGEIFFKGHNVRNMDLDVWHWQLLEKMREVLASHAKLRNFINPYSRLLEKIVLEKGQKRVP